MRFSALFLSSVLILSACANIADLTPEPSCNGNLLLKGCKPIVYFDFDSSELKPEAKENLNWAYEKLAYYPNKDVTVTGFADMRGNPSRNLDLAKRRAQAVKDYLVKKGIDKERIIVASDGEQEPLCKVSACQNVNRRAELDIYARNKLWSHSKE